MDCDISSYGNTRCRHYIYFVFQAIWIVTFLATVILDADIGIGIGILFSLFTIALRTQM